MKRHLTNLPTRRQFLQGLAAVSLLSTTALTAPAFAQVTPQAAEFAFDFDSFSARMQEIAAADFVPPSRDLPAAFADLDYDAYRRIQYSTDASKWLDDNLGYRLQAFHMGWLFPEPVQVYEIQGGTARSIGFSAKDFDYHDDAVEAAAAEVTDFPGVAGFRINAPMNSTAMYDEVVSFLGASYFRALGRNNNYGLSARGLVMNTWLEGPEEFPRFSEFYVEKPTAIGNPLTIYAALEGPSVAGAYRFILTPAGEAHQETTLEVTARLYFRGDVTELGIAPLTSMYLFAEANRTGFDDYRPQVHDSNGLLIQNEAGEVTWRALNNAATLGTSYFWENNPRAFGLYQRGRDFEAYQDAGAHYERRPSLRIEPIGNWGQGHVRLVEIPSRLEGDDNIAAFWIPEEKVTAGSSRELSYRMVWGDLNPDSASPIAHVAETRSGVGGVSGVEAVENFKKFVIDFAGGKLASMTDETQLEVVAEAAGGTITSSVLSRVDANGVWRLVLDVETGDSSNVELKAYVMGLGRKLTETWLYQWRP
ncbi:glucans biosynthesis protein [Devosia sp. YR412]|nr:glucans biosynthesis protein [Devosia sp. YR412]